VDAQVDMATSEAKGQSSNGQSHLADGRHGAGVQLVELLGSALDHGDASEELQDGEQQAKHHEVHSRVVEAFQGSLVSARRLFNQASQQTEEHNGEHDVGNTESNALGALAFKGMIMMPAKAARRGHPGEEHGNDEVDDHEGLDGDHVGRTESSSMGGKVDASAGEAESHEAKSNGHLEESMHGLGSLSGGNVATLLQHRDSRNALQHAKQNGKAEEIIIRASDFSVVTSRRELEVSRHQTDQDECQVELHISSGQLKKKVSAGNHDFRTRRVTL